MTVAYNQNLSEVLALLGGVHAVAQTAGSVSSTAVSMARHRRLIFLIDVGTPGGGGTVDAKLQAATTSGGSYADIASAAITQVTATGWAILEIKAETLNGGGQGPWVKCVVTVGTATTPISVIILGSVDRYEPASDLNITGVATPVVV